jgi:hypothetical protein
MPFALERGRRAFNFVGDFLPRRHGVTEKIKFVILRSVATKDPVETSLVEK